MSECQWIENVDDMSADYLCVTHGCFALGRAFDHDLCEIARLRAQVQALRDVCEQQVKSDSTFYGLWEYNQAVMAAQARALRLHRAVEVCPEADDRWVGPCPCNHPEWHWLICQECCTRAGDQTEECATSHDHGPAKPRCATATALDISHPQEAGR